MSMIKSILLGRLSLSRLIELTRRKIYISLFYIFACLFAGVVQADAPDCEAAYASPSLIWPPNHDLKSITIGGMDDAEISIQCVYQDEPLNTQGDGNTEYDAYGIGSSTVQVRAERVGSGNGRFYHIDFVASYGSNSCQGTVSVAVPKSKKKTPTDDGRLYTSSENTSLCGGQNQNSPPVFESSPPQTVTVGDIYAYQISVSDAESDPLSLTLTQGPAGLTLDANNLLIQWNPSIDQIGEHDIEIVVADDQGGSAIQSYTLRVLEPVNHDPEISSIPPLQASVATLYVYEVEASDPDNDNIAFTISGPEGMMISEQGVVNWIPQFEDVGSHPVTIIVEDGRGGTANQSFELDVPIVNSNPVILSQPVPQAILGLPYSYQVEATDVDGDNLIFSLIQNPSGMQISPETGLLSWVPSAGQEGEHAIQIQVSDGQGGFADQAFDLTVIIPNSNPTIVSNAPTTAKVGVIYSYQVEAEDEDGDVLSFALSASPIGATINESTGLVSWTPVADQQGDFEFTVIVTDGQNGSTSQNFVVNVENTAPEITSQAITSVPENAIYSYTVEAFDPDGPDQNALSFALNNAPAGMVINSLNGEITWQTDFSSAGEYAVDVQVTDTRGASDTQSFTLLVSNINRTPVALDQIYSGAEDTTITIELAGNDLDGDVLSYVTLTQPASGNLTGDASNLIFEPSENFNGDVQFTYLVNDGFQDSNIATVTISILSVNDQPLALDDASSTQEETAVTITVLSNDSDVDGDSLSVENASTATNGVVAVNADSTITYTPNDNFVGSDSFTYTISDGNGGSATASVSVSVNAVNDAPIALNDAANTDEDTAVIIAVLGNDSDVDGDSLSVESTSAATNGVVIINADNTVTYTPNENFVGSDSFTYVISDDNGGSATANVSVSVNAVNDAPIALNDAANTDEDTAVTIAVLGNDSDVDGDSLSVGSASAPANGVAAINADNTVTYTPNDNFVGSDSFTYTISDGNGGSATASVSVSVNAVNDAPIAINDAVSTDEDTAVTIAVLGNDSDIDGDSLSVDSTSAATNGVVAINADNTVTYTPNDNFVGSGSFTYTIGDGNGGSATASVSVSVNAVNDAPIAINDVASTDEDVAVTIAVLDNDSDIDGDTLSVESASTATNGVVAINADNTVTYTPNENFVGSDSFTYTIRDGNGGSATAGVSVSVNAVNDAPIALNDVASTDEDAAVTITVVSNDSDVDGDSLSVGSASAPANGVAAINADNTVTYTPNENFVGADSFTYTISDGNGGSATASVSVSVNAVNDAPIAINDAVNTDEDTAVTIAVISNDSDVDGDSLSVDSTSTATNGVVAINADNTVAYTPNENFVGSDSFTYMISDGNGGAATASVSVSVNAVNDAPVAINDAANTDEDTAVTIAVLSNDSDVDGDSLSVESTSAATNGVIAINADNTVTYTPNDNFVGSDSFTYTIGDGNGGSATASVSVSVNAVNDAPIALNDAANTDEDTALTIAVLGNDSDVDGDSLSVDSASTATNGVVAINADNTIAYTPNENFVGADSFTYSISDGNGGSATASVSVSVNAVNDAPIAINDAANTEEDTAMTIAVLGNDSDVDGDSLSVESTSSATNGVVVVNADNTITYTPSENFVGSDSFTYTISDGNGGSATASVSVSVNAVNDAPIALNDAASTDEDTAVIIALLANDSDVDGDALTVTNTNSVANGDVIINADNTVTFTPSENFAGDAGFDYVIEDGNGSSASASVSVAVNAVNDAPVTQSASLVGEEDVSLNVFLAATDIENAQLSYLIVTQPASGVLSGNAPELIYTPNENFNGSDSFSFSVNDGELDSNISTVELVIAPVNDAPVITSLAPESGQEQSLYSYDVDAIDVDGDTLAFELLIAPQTMTIDSVSGLIQWSPAANDIGDNAVSVRVYDEADGEDIQNFTIVVAADVNTAPNITSLPLTRIAEDMTYSCDVDATDAELDTLSFNLIDAAPEFSINNTTGGLTATDLSRFAEPLLTNNSSCSPNSSAILFDEPTIKFHWNGSELLEQFKQVQSAPVVAQITDDNGDGLVNDSDDPDLLFTTYSLYEESSDYFEYPAYIRVVSGMTGEEMFTISAYQTMRHQQLAVGDIDNDGLPEIVAAGFTYGVNVFDNTGRLKWSALNEAMMDGNGGPVIADIDSDGFGEIIVGDAVLDHQGNILWTTSNRHSGGFLSDISYKKMGAPAIADIDLDGENEILFGSSAFDINGNLIWQHGSFSDGYTAVADIDPSTPQPEIIVGESNRSTIRVLDYQGNELWFYDSWPAGPDTISRPIVGNFDNDSEPEILVGGDGVLLLFNGDGSRIWEVAPNPEINYYSDNITYNIAAMDLNGDGVLEILTQSRTHFRILSSQSGATIYERALSADPSWGGITVADIDKDGHGEILLPATQIHFTDIRTDFQIVNATFELTPSLVSESGLLVLEDDFAWSATRQTSTQFALDIELIDESGRLSADPIVGWTKHNTFGVNQFDSVAVLNPDLVVSHLALSGSTLSAIVRNRGASDVTSPFVVSVYDGNPNNGGILLGEDELTQLLQGESHTITLDLLDLNISEIFIEVDSNENIRECSENNNLTAAPLVRVLVSDEHGLTDEQAFIVSVGAVNRSPVADVPSPVSIQEGQQLIHAINVNDPNIGDGLSYSLVSGPEGVSIDSEFGVIRWSPNSIQVGIFTITVEVTDLDGESVIYNLDVTVNSVDLDSPSYSNVGREFWVGYLQNVNPEAGDIELSVTISAEEGATGVIDIPVTGEQIAFDLAPGTIEKIIVPNNLLPLFTAESDFINYFQPFSEQSNRSLRISSDRPITVYGLNEKLNTTDGFTALPTEVLGQRYIISSSHSAESSQFTLVATEDNTEVTVIATEATYPSIVDGDNPLDTSLFIPEGVATTITLNQGESYSLGVFPSAEYDTQPELTGSEIISSKPVAVFSGARCGKAPDERTIFVKWDPGGIAPHYRNEACDHVVEQLFPTQNWYNEYIVAPTHVRNRIGDSGAGNRGDMFDVVAQQDQTVVKFDGVIAAVLNQGEFYRRLINTPAKITANKPVQVNQFVTGAEFEGDNTTPRVDMGDPIMVLAQSPEQALSQYRFLTPTDVRFEEHYINVIATANAIDTIMLDDVAVDASLFKPIQGTNYYYAQIPVVGGEHFLRGDYPFSAMAYGFADFEAYGYGGGSRVANINSVSSITVTPEHSSMGIGQSNCFNITVENNNSDPVPFAPVQVATQGVNNVSEVVVTDTQGHCQFCYQGYFIGEDSVNFTVGSQQIAELVQWTAKPEIIENLAPQILSNPITVARVAEPYQYQIVALDPERDELSYKLIQGVPEGSPVNDMVINPFSGLITWNSDWTTSIANSVLYPNRDFEVIVEVSDSAGNSTVQRYFLKHLSNSTEASVLIKPRITSSPSTVIASGQTYSYQVSANDVVGEPISYSLIDAPASMVIGANGLITWDTTIADEGAHNVVIEARTTRGSFDRQGYSLAVLPAGADEAPVIFSSPFKRVEINSTYRYQVVAADPNGDALTYNLITSPLAMTISAEGLVELDADSSMLGLNPIVIEVSDGTHAVNQSFDLSVLEVGQLTNSSPVLLPIAPPTMGKVGVQYSYTLPVEDPEDDPLNYSIVEGPSGMVIGTNGAISWTPSATGSYSIVASVDDGEFIAERLWDIEVFEYAPLSAEIIVSPEFADPGEEVQIQIVVSNPAGAVDFDVNYSHEDNTDPNIYYPKTLSLDENNSVTINTLASHYGNWSINAYVNDGAESVSVDAAFFVRDYSDLIAPQVSVATPVDFEVVTAPTEIVASVYDENILDWTVYLQKPDGSLLEEIGQGTTNIDDAVVATIDPTLLKNGLYQVIVEARDNNGRYTSAGKNITVEGQLKVGHFSVTFEELSIQLAGIPLQVTRTYDSRERNSSMDFGYGWSLDYQSAKVEESDIPGRGWSVSEQYAGPITNVCVDLSYMQQVVVTLPDGSVEKFMPSFSPQCAAFSNGVGDLNFVAVDDTRSTLRQLDYSTVVVGSGELLDLNGAVVNPTRYELTTEEGLVYIVEQDFGIHQVRDRNGNTLTYSDLAITHSTGVQVDFVRDAQDRITSIIAPDGTTLSYSYDASGDLRTITDQLGNDTQHSYENDHYLTDTVDARGITAMRSEYDEDGRLVAHIDANGNRIEMSHDITGRQEVVTDRRGNATIYEYDSRGNVVTETNALGETTTRSYDDYDNMLSETDALGNTTEWTYDSSGNRLTETDALGHQTVWTYNSRKQVLTETNDLGHVRTNIYDGNGNLISIEDELGYITTYTYNANGQLTSTTDALDNVTLYEVDEYGRRSAIINPLGVRTENTYDDMGRQVSVSTSRTNNEGEIELIVSTNVYDDRGLLVETIDPLGNSSYKEYDAAGLEVARIDANGNRTEVDYDSLGRLTQTTYADGSFETVDYDEEGNEVLRSDRLGLITNYSYDSLNRLTETTNPDFSSARQVFDEVGRVTRDINTLDYQTEYEYDEIGRRVSVIDALGYATNYTYDALGRNTLITDALLQNTSYVYDANGRLIETAYDDASFISDAYDALGRKIASTDEAGITTQYSYSALGNLLSVTDVLGNETIYTYDEQGNKVSQTDAEGRTTYWEYDVLGRNISRTLPLGQVETMTYDKNGNLVSYTDFNGQTTTYEYNSVNRNTQINHADGRIETRTYDANGNLTEVDVDGEVTSYQYTNNRLVNITYPDFTSISYDYDSEGNRTNLDTSTQNVVYTFDALNRLSSVQQGGSVTNYLYNPVGNRNSVTYPNGVTTDYVYDTRNRLVSVDHNESGISISNYSYVLADTGHRMQMTDHSGRVVDYSYDSLYRLVSEEVTGAINGDSLSVWTYDSVGNRLTQTIDGDVTTYSYDDNDRLLTESGAEVTTYSYDENGNTVSKSVAGQLTTYSHNSQNHIIRVDNGMDLLDYAYDYKGIRQSKSVNGVTVNYLVDPNRDYAQVLEEYDDSFTTLVSYLFGDDLISQDRSGIESFYQYDAQGSTRGLTDNNGDLIDEYIYSAFGELTGRFGSSENSYLYTGEQFDKDIGQYYLRARYYDQVSGRFTQMDTWAGEPQSPRTLHKYLYALSSPSNFTDPTGNVSLSDIAVSFRIQGQLLAQRTLPIGKQIVNDLISDQVKHLVFEAILEAAQLSLLDVLNDPVKSQRNKTVRGTFAHTNFEKRMEILNKKVRKYGISLKVEQFRDKTTKAPVGRRAKNSVGLDLVIYRGSTAILAIDLKTGRGFSRKGIATRTGVFNLPIVEILVGRK